MQTNGKSPNPSGNAVKELQHPFNQDVRQEAPPCIFTLQRGLQIKHPGSLSPLLLTNAGIHLQKLDKLTIMCHKVQTTNSESQPEMHHHLVY